VDAPPELHRHGPQTPVAIVQVTFRAQSPSEEQDVLQPVGAAVLHPHGAHATSDPCVQDPAAHTPAG
jgi:hypothetical protein